MNRPSRSARWFRLVGLAGSRQANTCLPGSNWPLATSTTPAGSPDDQSSWWLETPPPIHKGDGRRRRIGSHGCGCFGGGVSQRGRPRRCCQGRSPWPAVPLLVSSSRRTHRTAGEMGRAPRPGAVPQLENLRGLPPEGGSQPHRSSGPAECLLGIRNPHSPGLSRSIWRLRLRTRHALARTYGGVRRTR
jgi:hypothetical protein